MSYLVTTYFDKNSWEKQGIDWLRKAKTVGLTGFIIGNLPEDAVIKAKSLGFNIVPIIAKFGDERDYYWTIAETLPKGQKCLFLSPELSPLSGLSENNDVVCNSDLNLNFLDIASSVRNLKHRAKSIKLIQSKLDVVLSAKFILGTWDFWKGFAAFHNYLKDKDYIEKRNFYTDFVFNLYVANTQSITVEII